MKIIIDTKQAMPDEFKKATDELVFLLTRHYKEHGNFPAGFETPKGSYEEVLQILEGGEDIEEIAKRNATR